MSLNRRGFLKVLGLAPVAAVPLAAYGGKSEKLTPPDPQAGLAEARRRAVRR